MLKRMALSQLQLNCLTKRWPQLGKRYTQQHHAVNAVLKTCIVLLTFNLYSYMPLSKEKAYLIETSNKYLLSIKFIHMFKKCL